MQCYLTLLHFGLCHFYLPNFCSTNVITSFRNSLCANALGKRTPVELVTYIKRTVPFHMQWYLTLRHLGLRQIRLSHFSRPNFPSANAITSFRNSLCANALGKRTPVELVTYIKRTVNFYIQWYLILRHFGLRQIRLSHFSRPNFRSANAITSFRNSLCANARGKRTPVELVTCIKRTVNFYIQWYLTLPASNSPVCPFSRPNFRSTNAKRHSETHFVLMP